jgi:hypothetical protein
MSRVRIGLPESAKTRRWLWAPSRPRKIQRLASTYRPLATRTNRGEEPETSEAKAPLTELHATASPSIVSTAAWISRARIGSPPVIQDPDQSIDHPARPSRSTPLARHNPRRRSAGAHRRQLPDQTAHDPCRLWFDSTPVRSIRRRFGVACGPSLAAAEPTGDMQHGDLR